MKVGFLPALLLGKIESSEQGTRRQKVDVRVNGAADERLVAVAKGFGRPVGPTDARGDSTPFKSV